MLSNTISSAMALLDIYKLYRWIYVIQNSALYSMNAEHSVHLPSTFPSKQQVFWVRLTKHDSDSCLLKHLMLLLLHWKAFSLVGIPDKPPVVGLRRRNDDRH